MEFVRIFEPNIRNLSMCSEKESIDQNIELIITTCPGEDKYDPEYGCEIWDLDFERVVSKSRWEEQFVKHISESIKKYEPRVSNISPGVEFIDTRKDYEFTGATSIRKRVDIRIDATIISTGTRCCFYYSLYLGPLSSD
jgi:phage baseplate assembly protein W